jgi:hypothetical protein
MRAGPPKRRSHIHQRSFIVPNSRAILSRARSRAPRTLVSLLVCSVISLIALSGCGGGGGSSDSSPQQKDLAVTNAVEEWNDNALRTVGEFAKTDPAGGLDPMHESRLYAMVFTAMHDSLNGIDHRYQPYLGTTSSADAAPAAAVAAAAHDVLIALLPGQKALVDGMYAASINAVPAGAARDSGVALGQRNAAAIIAARSADKSDLAQTAYSFGTEPGAYRATPPFDGPPFNGFAAVPGWGNVKPFALTSGAQFRAPAPYTVLDAAYTADFNEIKALGSAVSTARTADQSAIAKFWLESSPTTWNRIAHNLAVARSLDGWERGRLYALVAIAVTDAYIASVESKYVYNFWRPITAIHLAANDGNASTEADADWAPFDPVTPPIPDYPSAHATAGGAAGAAMRLFFGRDDVPFSLTTGSLPGTSRSFASLSQAERENADSRVFVGYHFRLATTAGVTQGNSVGAYAFNNQLKPAR